MNVLSKSEETWKEAFWTVFSGFVILVWIGALIAVIVW